MIITRTPFRISFFGGGTDYPDWYKENGGSVISTTINKYCYLSCRSLPPFFDHKYRVVYSVQELVKKISEIDHPSVKNTFGFFKINKGIEVHHQADLPAKSGLGSSSSFTVGLINALGGLNGEIRNKRQLALDAIHIEQNLIKENVGSQDQTAVAFGGLNRIDFGGVQEISVQPLILNPKRLENLENNLMLFFTGLSRNASNVAKEQISNINNRKAELTTMHQIVDKGITILKNNKTNLNEFGKLLNEGWKIKKSLSSKISNSYLDNLYNTGMKAGALGGKLLGAGGGGFILFFARPEAHKKIRDKLKGLLHVPFKFEHLGSQIIYHAQETEYNK